MAKAKKVAKQAKKAAAGLAQVDQAQAHRAARAPDGPVLGALGRATELADQPPLIALSIGTMLAGVALRRPVMLRSGVRMLASHALATAAKTVIKRAVDRSRPSRAVREGARLAKGSGTKDSSLNSMPSGHTAGAVAVAQAVATESARLALPVRAAALGVGVLQPRRGKHYLSDVAVGAAIGWASARLTNVALRRLARALRRADRLDVEEEAAAHPS